MEKIKEGTRGAWGDKSRDAVIQKFKNGEKEKNVVKVVCGAYGVNDKSVRRCVAGLNLIRAKDDELPSDELRERFENLSGPDRYITELRRAVNANPIPGLEAQLTYLSKKTAHLKSLQSLLNGLRGLSPMAINSRLAASHPRLAQAFRIEGGDSVIGADPCFTSGSKLFLNPNRCRLFPQAAVRSMHDMGGMFTRCMPAYQSFRRAVSKTSSCKTVE